jgi:hypothetical protein
MMEDIVDVADFIDTLVRNDGNNESNDFKDPYGTTVHVGPTAVSPCLPTLTAHYGYDLEIRYSLTITNYAVTHVSIDAWGDAAASVVADGTLIDMDHTFTLGPRVILEPRILTSFVLPLGPVPIPISVSGSVNASLSVALSGAISLNAVANVSGSVYAGVEWSSAAGHTPHQSIFFNPTATITSMTATAHATAFLAANTQLLVEAMYTVGLQTNIVAGPVITANVSFASGGISVTDGANGVVVSPLPTDSQDIGSPCHPSLDSNTYTPPAVGVGVGVRVNVTAAAVIGFEGFTDAFDICSGPCFHHMWTLDSWCVTL